MLITFCYSIIFMLWTWKICMCECMTTSVLFFLFTCVVCGVSRYSIVIAETLNPPSCQLWNHASSSASLVGSVVSVFHWASYFHENLWVASFAKKGFLWTAFIISGVKTVENHTCMHVHTLSLTHTPFGKVRKIETRFCIGNNKEKNGFFSHTKMNIKQ